MIRVEVKTPYKNFVFCEATLTEAKAYIEALIENGVEILDFEIHDRDSRVADIKAGKV